MTEKITAVQAYINEVMASLPEVKEKKEHNLKAGESLWGLAKQELGRKNVSNKEIQEYMLLIAKINGLNTVEKMNGLHANDKIYLPDKIEKLSQTTDKVKEKSSLEKSVEYIINLLKNDKTAQVQKANLSLKNSHYHIFRDKKYPNGFISKNSPVLSFTLDKNEQIVKLSLDDINDILKLRYDYDMDKNGRTFLREYPYRTVGQISKEDKELLLNEIKRLHGEYKKNPKTYY